MTERLQRFQEQSYARGMGPRESPKEANWTYAFWDLYADRPLAERQARSFAYALEHEPVYLFPLERLVGHICQACPGAGAPDVTGSAQDPRWADYAVWPMAQRRVREELPENEEYARYFCDGAAPGHVCWDFGLMLQHGAAGLIERHRAAAAATADEKAREFHAGVEITLEGMLRWVERHVQALRDAAAREGDPVRQRELLEMAEVCERVPRYPAATFREAVQSFLFQHLAVMFENPFGGNGPGRLDYYLWPYLEADLAAGRTTLEEARELITELLIKLHERIAPADGWVEAIPVGGRKPDGSCAVNPLSYLILEAITELKQTHPSVYVRLTDDAPADFVDLAVRNLLESGNRGQIYGDDAMIAALHADGVRIEDARHWTAGGCMEVSPQGCNGDLLFAFAHNVARTLELVLNGGCLLQTGERAIAHRKTLADYPSFEELLQDFRTELHRELGLLLRQLDIYLECYAKYRPSFLLSSMTHDCLERGRAINEGGARYPDYGGSGVGLPNVGDSLYAIKRAVFEDQVCTGAELLAALRDDFIGHERLHAYLRNLPKFGQDNPEVDSWTDHALRTFIEPLKAHCNPFGGHCRPIILGFVWVVQYGLQVGAMPDGRKSGRPLAHGLAPQSGAATRGLTAAIRSATRLSLREVGGGGAMMWDLDPAWARLDTVRPVLLTFTGQGGHIFQGNVISVDQLIAARDHPEEHRDLFVRVGGYSARFCTLSSQMQQEIIERYRYRG